MYCNQVLRVIGHLKLEIEIRNIWQNQDFERELISATGRSMVPVLAIKEGVGPTEWMAESADIIRFLETRQDSTQA